MVSGDFQNFLDYLRLHEYASNNLYEYLVAIITLVAILALIKVFKDVLLYELKKFGQKTKTTYDDLLIHILEGIGWPLYIFIAINISTNLLILPNWLNITLYYSLLVFAAYYAIKTINIGVQEVSNKIAEKKIKKGEENTGLLKLLTRIVKGIVWLLAILFILQNLGVEITSFIAGAGIIGIAVAFSLQNVLSDLFASFSIYFDEPFKQGDFIIIGEDVGVVKYIGLKSTRLQTLLGDELVVSNKELTETRVHNYKKMEKRRIVFEIGVTYNTPHSKLKKIPQIIKKIIDEEELTEPDRIHFKEFGDFSLKYEIVYYMLDSDFTKYREAQQNINLKIVKEFEKENIEFAFPTQTIHMPKQTK